MLIKRSCRKRKPRTPSSCVPNCLKWLFPFLAQKAKPVARKQKPVCDLGEDYYTTKELAEALKLSVSALCDYRRKGTGPKYTIVSYRNYRYPKSEVIRYLKEQTRTSTSANRNDDYNPNEQKGD